MSEQLNTGSPYKFLKEQEYAPVKMGPNNMPMQPETKTRPLAEVEFRTVRDTIFLIEAMDGTGDSTGKRYLDGERRYDGPCEAAVYLDKSARPVRALVNELWSDVSSEEQPTPSFLNIDKIDYLLGMGFSARDIEHTHIKREDVDIDKLPQKARELRVAEIRALYLADRSQLEEAERLIEDVRSGAMPPEELQRLWKLKTYLDGKHVAIVDEVRSSSATLHIADQLLAKAFPDAKLEPMVWTTPPVHEYTVVEDGELVDKLADTEKPPWYDNQTSAGRGGVDGKNPEWSADKERPVAQRIGKHVLGIPYTVGNNGQPDVRGQQLREDIRILAQRWREGKVKLPSQRR